MTSPISDQDKEFVMECIRRNRWTWAKTMPTIPHEYIVRNRCTLSNEEFTKLVTLQRNHGIFMWWWKYHLPYLHMDGYKYWTMGYPIEETTILNRQKLFNEYDAVANVYDTLLEEDSFQAEYAEVGNTLNSLIEGSVLEIGSGTGKLLEHIEIEPSFYTGIDPSKQMVAQFYRKLPSFHGRILCRAFEEYEMKNKDTWIVSLFGSISYIMKQYIPRIEKNADHYFLMFYAPGHTPEMYLKTGVPMHHFNYGIEEIRGFLPNAKLTEFHNYIVAQK